ncbi:hypothetical protein A464_3043 [Salmonella bongori N268-08]|uniref:Uncharacterized protein n=1 Tax=Salmonella bongori N268-08 TaxID=1197719 RepID=S5NIU0_SALBN|nr:hypothetical protein A464_3043 [Salmonella bongori N268-08]
MYKNRSIFVGKRLISFYSQNAFGACLLPAIMKKAAPTLASHALCISLFL